MPDRSMRSFLAYIRRVVREDTRGVSIVRTSREREGCYVTDGFVLREVDPWELQSLFPGAGGFRSVGEWTHDWASNTFAESRHSIERIRSLPRIDEGDTYVETPWVWTPDVGRRKERRWRCLVPAVACPRDSDRMFVDDELWKVVGRPPEVVRFGCLPAALCDVDQGNRGETVLHAMVSVSRGMERSEHADLGLGEPFGGLETG